MQRLLVYLAGVLLIAGVTRAEIAAQANDLTLADCLAQTFRNNPGIQTARADIERAAGDKLVISSHLLPQLAAQEFSGYQGGSYYNLNKQSGEFSELMARFSQPLIDVGIPPTLRRGRLEVALAGQNLNRVVTDRLHEARGTFLTALYFRDLLALYGEIEQHLQANVIGAQQRLDAGLGARAAVAQAQVQALNLANGLMALSNQYFAATTRLAELTGNNFCAPTNRVVLPRPVGTLTYRPVAIDLPAETTDALAHRADVGFLRKLVAVLAADEQIVSADFFPRLALEASTLFVPPIFQANVTNNEIRAGVGLTWRVIDNGQVIGARHQRDAVRQEYTLVLHKLEEAVPRELATIAGALQTAAARRNAYDKAAAAAAENLQLIEAKVALGQATQLDFLNAQSDLLSVRAGLIDAIFNHEIACANLNRATGRYLEFKPGAGQ